VIILHEALLIPVTRAVYDHVSCLLMPSIRELLTLTPNAAWDSVGYTLPTRRPAHGRHAPQSAEACPAHLANAIRSFICCRTEAVRTDPRRQFYWALNRALNRVVLGREAVGHIGVRSAASEALTLEAEQDPKLTEAFRSRTEAGTRE
jgi:hypothetical protein